MLGGQLVHKPPEAKILAIHSAHNQQHQATPQHHMQQTIHLQQPQQQLHQQQMQQQQSKPGSPSTYLQAIFQNVKKSEITRKKRIFETGSRKEFNKNANSNSYPSLFLFLYPKKKNSTRKNMWEISMVIHKFHNLKHKIPHFGQLVEFPFLTNGHFRKILIMLEIIDR